MPVDRAVILDACVLVQAPLRDTLLRLAEHPGLYHPRWSEEIIAEMQRALENKIGLAPSKTAYLVRELRRHFPDSWVTGLEPLVRTMTNHAKDRHVLAAAVRAGVQTIVTFNKSPGPHPAWRGSRSGGVRFVAGIECGAFRYARYHSRQQRHPVA